MTTPPDNLSSRRALMARLPRTWPAFFERHGNFTDAQVATIPRLLDGHNVMLCAATASGKTEAAMAPLIERHCPPTRAPHTLALLYLVPTRALVNDMAARLAYALDVLHVSLAVRTRDLSTFRPERPADVLLLTPESLDSLLTSQAKVFRHLRAVVIDELHLFDGSPRGDQLRVLLNRLRHIRRYACASGDAPDEAMQYVALSATLAAPEQVAARYFTPVQVVRLSGGRRIEAEHVEMSPSDVAPLHTYLATFSRRGWRKALAFCNSRAEVEAYAAAVRQRSPFGNAVYVHYSNIEAKRRHEIEHLFAQDDAAICFASTTLELGIDIGNVDIVILIGPPGNHGSFLQRIGRGNRRRGITRVCCGSRTGLERVLFDALLAESAHPSEREERSVGAFRPAVAIQQIFSLLKQSTTGAIRLQTVVHLMEGMLLPSDVEAILGQLQQRGYLVVGRPGEWRAGPRLNELVDQQMGKKATISLYSNIQSSDMRTVDIRDQHTQQTVATVDANWLARDILTLEGRVLDVTWYDGEAMWVASSQDREAMQHMWYRSTRQFLSHELARLLPTQVGLPPGAAPFVRATEGWWWFHCLGDLYGRAILGLLRYHVRASETPLVGLCLYVADESCVLPDWTAEQVRHYLEDTYQTWEPMLNLGPFHMSLPVEMRRRAVVEQFDVVGFLGAVAELRPLSALDTLAEDLLRLVEQG